MGFHIHVDITEAANKLGQSAELIKDQITNAVGILSAGAQSFIVQTANRELEGYQRTAYLGKDNENIKRLDLGNGMWVVEVDEKARWIEEGRERMFMDWLLKNAKTAKDGSKYKVIPMPQAKGAGSDGWNAHKPALREATEKVLKDNKISLKRLQRDSAGKPLVGLMRHIPTGRLEAQKEVATYGTPERNDWFSKPRTKEDSWNTGLPEHNGIFYLQGLMVVQFPDKTAKHGVNRQAITYRVISSKHQQEGRWFYPKVEPLNAVTRAAEWAQKEMDEWMKDFNSRFADINGG